MKPYIPSEAPPRPEELGRRRDRHYLTVAAVTGIATVGGLTATGWLAGEAAHTWSAQQSTPATTPPVAPVDTTTVVQRTARHKAHEGEREDSRRVVVKQRPTRTQVSTQYVTAPAPVGGGGSVSSTPSQPTHHTPAAPSSGS